MDKKAYYFYEWLILAKGVSKEKIISMKKEESEELLKEYHKWENNLNKENAHKCDCMVCIYEGMDDCKNNCKVCQYNNCRYCASHVEGTC